MSDDDQEISQTEGRGEDEDEVMEEIHESIQASSQLDRSEELSSEKHLPPSVLHSMLDDEEKVVLEHSVVQSEAPLNEGGIPESVFEADKKTKFQQPKVEILPH